MDGLCQMAPVQSRRIGGMSSVAPATSYSFAGRPRPPHRASPVSRTKSSARATFRAKFRGPSSALENRRLSQVAVRHQVGRSGTT